MATQFQQFTGITVTLPAGASSLYQLITAALAATAFPLDPTFCPTSIRELLLQSPAGNAGTIAVGDRYVSATRCGYVLNANGSDTDRSFSSQVPMSEMWVYSSVAGQTLNVSMSQ